VKKRVLFTAFSPRTRTPFRDDVDTIFIRLPPGVRQGAQVIAATIVDWYPTASATVEQVADDGPMVELVGRAERGTAVGPAYAEFRARLDALEDRRGRIRSRTRRLR
jgi:hypothetical protein